MASREAIGNLEQVPYTKFIEGVREATGTCRRRKRYQDSWHRIQAPLHDSGTLDCITRLHMEVY